MSAEQKQSYNQHLNSGERGQSSASNSTTDKQKKSAPEYPPATERSQRTNSANFGEGGSDENVVTF